MANIEHEIHCSFNGSEFWLTCDGVEFARLSDRNMSQYKIEQFSKEELHKHVIEKHGKPVDQEILRIQFLKIYQENFRHYPDALDYVDKIRNLALDGINMIRPVDMPPFN